MKCKYCGEAAGLLSSEHRECAAKYQKGRTDIMALLGSSPMTPVETIASQVESIKSNTFISSSEFKQLLIGGWTAAVDKFLDDGVLDPQEEHQLVMLQKQFSLTQTELDSTGAYSRVGKAAVLRDVMSGTLPQRVQVSGSIPFNLQKGEQIVWLFNNVRYLEDKVRREYVGGSGGVSVRVMKGIYYRVGAYSGHSISHTERMLVDTGMMAITNKNIYFGGSAKSFRVALSKIVSFEPYSDGVGIVRDAANAKAQVFATGDGWFTHNLLSNLAQM